MRCLFIISNHSPPIHNQKYSQFDPKNDLLVESSLQSPDSLSSFRYPFPALVCNRCPFQRVPAGRGHECCTFGWLCGWQNEKKCILSGFGLSSPPRNALVNYSATRTISRALLISSRKRTDCVEETIWMRFTFDRFRVVQKKEKSLWTREKPWPELKSGRI
ncbi:hypothetical protein L596_006789 [Steinernema carpocapsae]|uniref:Uncharacterized protein n=1 Tax=Steinernema carpocapsae TaxID=34508 RepID=A0A4U5P6T2_STECR|nr:hypothetical protein L596_006789 [Steinernema carpocapsae]